MKDHLLKYSIIPFLVILTINACIPTEEGDIIIYNVNVIDVGGGKTIIGQDVITEGAKIKNIIPHGEAKLQASRVTIRM